MKRYCKNCRAVTPHKENGTCDRCDAINSKVTLIREKDGLIKSGDLVKFVEWSSVELGSRATDILDDPQVGLSCIVDPHRLTYVWLTTVITEITEKEEADEVERICFKTEKSDYILYRIKSHEKKKD